MTYHRSLFHFSVLILSVWISVGCENDTPAQLDDSSRLASQFHGTWLEFDGQHDSLHISFNATTLTFLEQAGYEYGLRREFAGMFSVSSSRLTLNYNYGSTNTLEYSFKADTLFLGAFTPPAVGSKYHRVSQAPTPGGWSAKVSILQERNYPSMGQSWGIASSDSFVVLLATSHFTNERELRKINLFSGLTNVEPSAGVRAIDIVESKLWLARDSLLVFRTISDTTTLASFLYRSDLSNSYATTGLAVGSHCFYVLIASFERNHGLLRKHSLDGQLLASTDVSVALQDLCLVGERLFATTGGEDFVELAPSSGRPISHFGFDGRPYPYNILGIGQSGSHLLVWGADSTGNHLSTIDVPL